MEYYFIASGPLQWLDLFESNMQSYPFNIQFNLPNGEIKTQQMAGLIEPIQLYRFIFPYSEATLAMVHNTLSTKGPTPAKEHLKLHTLAFRKLLGLQGFDGIQESQAEMPISRKHLQIIPIGIKPDAVGVIPTTGVEQEKL